MADLGREQREGGYSGPRLVSVPDVVGLPLRKALLLIQRAGLRADMVLYQESYEEKDKVLQQDPPRGRMVYSDRQVSLWVSRESYIKWLPALYQRSDPTGKNFVRDLLWIVQHIFGSIEEQLDFMHLYFDSYEAPETFLPWLASWSAMIMEEDWPVTKKRRLIKKAMELYRLRGTIRGLQLFISLFTGFEPEIRENEWPFRGCRVGISSAIGMDTVVLPPVDKAQSFIVVMPFEFGHGDATPEAIIRLQEIIELEKPANTQYMLKFAEPKQAVEEREFYRIGISSGINVGQEVVTPLPVNEETGEPIYPKERVEPRPAENPSVYELFGTKRRELPPITDVPRADNAPVEGGEVMSSKFGFEGAIVIQIDDMLRDLLGQDAAQSAAPTTPPPPRPDAPPKKALPEEDDAAKAMRLDYGARRWAAPKVELEFEGEGEARADVSVEGGAASTVESLSSATPVDAAPSLAHSDDDHTDQAEAMKVDVGDRRHGSVMPKVELDVERQVKDGDEKVVLSDEEFSRKRAEAQAEKVKAQDAVTAPKDKTPSDTDKDKPGGGGGSGGPSGSK